MKMALTAQHQVIQDTLPHPRWRDLYRIGFVASIAVAALIVMAVIVYFIWPYQPGVTSVAQIFADLQENRIAGLLSIEISVLFVDAFLILQALALYAALKRVNESYALIFLVLEIMGIAFFLIARPVAEMVYLSNQYAAATSEVARSQYLAAGEAMSALFNGTLWMWANLLIAVAGFLQSLLMLRSRVFSRATAYVGFVINVCAVGILVPNFAIATLTGLGSTIGGAVWYLLIARTFFQLGWGQKPARDLEVEAPTTHDASRAAV
jgi:hypothetical protein